MADLTLRGGMQQRRSMLVPILLAVALLTAAVAWFAHVYVHAAVTGTVAGAKTYPVHVEYKRAASSSGVQIVGANQAEDALYLVVDVTLQNHSEVPLFLSSFHGSFTLEDGSVMEASVIEKDDLPRLLKMFPQLKALVDPLGEQPLLRDQAVAKDATSRGYLIMYYNIPQSVWDKHKAADIGIDFYHQDRLTLPLPK